MITLSNANNALKTYYLGVLSNQLNVGINPFLAKIEHTSTDVYGKEIKKLAPYGLNGGVSSGAETDSLPVVGGNQYAEFVMDLKNLYGQIEISDKAIRASQNSVGAFVNLLNAEMEGLLHASKYNFGRMLFGNGTGLLSRVSEDTDEACITVDNIKNFIEGMIVDFYEDTGVYHSELKGARIVSVDRKYNTIVIDKPVTTPISKRCRIYVQGSRNNELTGLEAIFEGDVIYGLDKTEYTFLQPYVATEDDGVTASAIQRAIDAIEINTGNTIDIIMCSHDVRNGYVSNMAENRVNVDYMTVDGGFSAISYAGIPMIADRFVADGTMYLLNTPDFKLHQLCDWRWLEGEGGTVLHQVPGKPAYTATLVKYADLLCERPAGQAKITFNGTKAPARCSVVFDSNGGTTVQTQQVYPGNCAVEPKDPTLTGSTFNGWYSNGTIYDFTKPVYTDLHLSAKWS